MPKQTQRSTTHVGEDELFRTFAMGTGVVLLMIAVFALVMGFTSAAGA